MYKFVSDYCGIEVIKIINGTKGKRDTVVWRYWGDWYDGKIHKSVLFSPNDRPYFNADGSKIYYDELEYK